MMQKRNCFVFDIDGTLSDPKHRRHLIQGEDHNWGEFYALMNEDPVVEPVVKVLESLRDNGVSIILLSGREGMWKNYSRTMWWLSDNLIGYDRLYLRKKGDHRADDIIKLELMQNEIEPFYNVIGIFDDRTSVVNMWRKNGYFVFDVNQTGEIF